MLVIDVAGDAQVTGDHALCITHGADGEVDDAQLAVFTAVGPLTGFRLALVGDAGEYRKAADVRAQLASQLLAARLNFLGQVEQGWGVAANDFGAAITQQAFGAGVEQGNQAVGMSGDDADPSRRVEHCLQKAARFAGLFFMAHALQGGADPAGEQAHKLFIGLIKGRRARLAGREAQSAEALTGDPDAGADIAFQGKQRVTGVGGMFTLAHGCNGDYIIAAQGNAAIGVTEDEALTVLQGVGRRHLNPDLVGVRLDLADDADWHVIELCTQLQGLAQLFVAAQLRQCSNFIERA